MNCTTNSPAAGSKRPSGSKRSGGGERRVERLRMRAVERSAVEADEVHVVVDGEIERVERPAGAVQPFVEHEQREGAVVDLGGDDARRA
jgi:hypothetical protein